MPVGLTWTWKSVSLTFPFKHNENLSPPFLKFWSGAVFLCYQELFVTSFCRVQIGWMTDKRPSRAIFSLMLLSLSTANRIIGTRQWIAGFLSTHPVEQMANKVCLMSSYWDSIRMCFPMALNETDHCYRVTADQPINLLLRALKYFHSTFVTTWSSLQILKEL